MLNQLRSAVVATAVLVAATFLYALAGTAVAHVLFPHQANGSITRNGSALVGQNWASTRWFHGRPDGFGPYAPRATAPGSLLVSGATNLGPRSKVLLADTRRLVAWWHAQGVDPTPDLVTTSGSGYDPDITPADARAQIPMISRATGLSVPGLQALIRRETTGMQLGFLGSPTVNVLHLNEALAAMERR